MNNPISLLLELLVMKAIEDIQSGVEAVKAHFPLSDILKYDFDLTGIVWDE